MVNHYRSIELFLLKVYKKVTSAPEPLDEREGESARAPRAIALLATLTLLVDARKGLPTQGLHDFDAETESFR